MDEHIQSVLKGKLCKDLEGHVIEALELADERTWCLIKEHLLNEMQQIDCVFHLEIFEWEQRRNELLEDFRTCAKKLIKSNAQQAAKQAPSFMRHRFGKELNSGLAAGGWKGEDGIKNIIRQARSAAVKSLSVMAVERLEDLNDNVEDTLSCFLDGSNIDGIPNSTTWDTIPSKYTLIPPKKCQLLLKSFREETEEISDTTIAILKKHDGITLGDVAASPLVWGLKFYEYAYDSPGRWLNAVPMGRKIAEAVSHYTNQ